MKVLVVLVSLLTSSFALAQAQPQLVCDGVAPNGDQYSVEVSVTNGKLQALVSQSWGDGEELDSDTVQVRETVRRNSTVLAQVGTSKFQLVDGLSLELRGKKGTLFLASAPAGDKNLRFRVLCK